MSGSEAFELAPWYASEEAKRNLGSICREVFAMDTAVGLLGTPAEPLLVLERGLPAGPDDVEVSIDEARADWSNVTLAAAIYGTRFRIQSRRHPSGRKILLEFFVILHRHPKARHPAERYFRSVSPDAERLAQQIEALANEIRKLGQKLERVITGLERFITAGRGSDLDDVAGRLEKSADLIERRFRDLWRLSNSYGTT